MTATTDNSTTTSLSCLHSLPICARCCWAYIAIISLLGISGDAMVGRKDVGQKDVGQGRTRNRLLSGSNVLKAQKSKGKHQSSKEVIDEAQMGPPPSELESVGIDLAQRKSPAPPTSPPLSDPNIVVTPQGSFRMEKAPMEKRPAISPISKLIRKQRVVKYQSAKPQPETERIVGYVPPGISKSDFLDCHSTFLNLDNDEDGEETAAEVSSMGCPPVSSVGCSPSPNKAFASPTPLPRDRNQSETSLEPLPTPKACSPTWELDSTPSRSSSYHHQLREKLSMNELVKSLPAVDSGVARHSPASIVNYQRTYTNQIDTTTPVVVIPEPIGTDDLGMTSRQQGERPGEVLILERYAVLGALSWMTLKTRCID